MQQREYIPITQERHVIEVGFFKALAIISGAILVSIVGTAFALVGTANSDHFALITTTNKVDAIEKNYVSRELMDVKFQEIIRRLDNIEKKI